MKKLLAYEQDGNYIIERVNEFNHSFKQLFESESELFEGLEVFESVFEQYEIEINDNELYAKVINFCYTSR